MILYSDRDDHYSQRVRIVLAEKDISAEINEAKPEETPEDILSISPSICLLYTSPSPRDLSSSRMPSSA